MFYRPRFRIHEQSEDKVVFRRVVSSTQNTFEIFTSRRLSSAVTAIRKRPSKVCFAAIVSVLPDMPIMDGRTSLSVKTASSRNRTVFPTTHVLQFNPESVPLKNSEFRRALAFVLNREKILAETVLRDPAMRRGPSCFSSIPVHQLCVPRSDRTQTLRSLSGVFIERPFRRSDLVERSTGIDHGLRAGVR